jgi:VCBS repeat-containing protein
MATFIFAKRTSVDFNTATDVLVFDSGIAGHLVFEDARSQRELIVRWYFDSLGNDAMRLEGTTYESLRSENISFANGSLFLKGSPGDDTLSGSSKSDYLDIKAGGGDVVLAGGGNDRIFGGSTLGNDRIDGGPGLDEIRFFSELIVTPRASTFTGVERFFFHAPTQLELSDDVFSGVETTPVFRSFASLRLDGSALTVSAGVIRKVIAYGRDDNDTLIGGPYDDSLTGGPDGDTLTGGPGNDTFAFALGSVETDSPPDAIDTITDFATGDKIVLQYPDSYGRPLIWSGELNFNPANNRNTPVGNPGVQEGSSPGDGLADVFWRYNPVHGRIELWIDGNDDGKFGSADIAMALTSVGGRTELSPQDFANRLIMPWRGTDIGESFPASTGIDIAADNVARSEGGDDTLLGGAGDDGLNGGAGDDSIDGGTGHDWLIGAQGADTLLGGDGQDRLLGESGDDQLLGGADADTLAGGDGDDTITGGPGPDSLTGGSGNDTFVLRPDSSRANSSRLIETITDFTVGDWIDLPGKTDLAMALPLIVSGELNFNPGNESNFTTGIPGVRSGSRPGDGLADVFWRYNPLQGSIELWVDADDDGLIGAPDIAAAVIPAGGRTGLSAKDFARNFVAWRGTDAGESLLLAAEVDNAADNIAYALGGNDTLPGGPGNDSLYGGAGSDSITGQAGNDLLLGEAGADTLAGGLGVDTLSGGLGADTLGGGSGSDTFVFRLSSPQSDSSPGSPDTVTDFADGDRIALPGASTISLDQQGAEKTHQLPLIIGGPLNFNSANNPGFPTGNQSVQLGSRAGDGFADVFWRYNPLLGRIELWVDANDDGRFSEVDIVVLLTGTGEKTALSAADFADSLVAWRGGDGAESFPSAAGIDIAASNIADGQGGNDTLSGGLGDDSLFGGTGNDSIDGDTGADQLGGGDGDDSLEGGADHDTLEGEAGSDMLRGGGGDDRLLGGPGDDRLLGEAGADWLAGGDGSDTLAGGANADAFVFGLDSPTGTIDTITDFASGDLIVLPGVNPLNSLPLVIGGQLDFNSTDNPNFSTGNTGLQPRSNAADGLADVFWRYNPVLGRIELWVDSNDDGRLGAVDTVVLLNGVGNKTTLRPEDFARTFVAWRGTVGSEVFPSATGLDIAANNVAYALGGNDTLSGGPGSDSLFGDAGDDQLFGEWGADSLRGGAGDDQIHGDQENDLLLGEEGADTLRGGAGDDRLAGGEGKDRALGGTGDDLIEGDGDDDTLEGEEGADTLRGGVGDDLLSGQAGDDLLLGDAGADTLRGGDADDSLSGQAGNDLLLGEAGRDSLHGGDGNDTLTGGLDADLLTGGPGDDTFTFGLGATRTDSSPSGVDTITDFASGDRIWLPAVNTANNLPLVNSGLLNFNQADSRHFAAGNSSLQPGANPTDGLADVFWRHNPALGRIELWVDADDDGRFSEADIVAVLASPGGKTTLTAQDFAQPFVAWRGTDAGERFPPTTVVDTVIDDLFVAQGGNDTLSGGVGDDSLFGGTGDDAIDGGSGTDRLVGDSGQDTLQGGDGDDLLFGDSGDDVLLGQAGADTLAGGDGADTLTGGAGNDTFAFGAGTTRSHSSPTTSDRVTDFTAGDRIDLSGTGTIDDLPLGIAGQLDFNPTNKQNFAASTPGLQSGSYPADGFADVFWRHNPVQGRIELWADADDDGRFSEMDTVVFLTSAPGKTTLIAADFVDPFVPWRGTDAGDSFPPSSETAMTAYDAVYGLGGNDTLFGGAGNEQLHGGAGRDWIRGGEGNDTITGGEDSDALSGGTGDDALSGDTGEDSLYGESGADTLTGGDGADSLNAEGWDPSPLGADAAGMLNVLLGGDGNDELYGGRGDDSLDGGAGNDSLFTGDFSFGVLRLRSGGTDTLVGGPGADTLHLLRGVKGAVLTGGPGADRFALTDAPLDDTDAVFSHLLFDSFSPVSAPCRITDFDASQGDLLRLGITNGIGTDQSRIGTDISTGREFPLVWCGKAPASFSGELGQSVPATVFGGVDLGGLAFLMWTFLDATTSRTVLFMDRNLDLMVGDDDFRLEFDGNLVTNADAKLNLSEQSFTEGTFSTPKIGTAAPDTATTAGLAGSWNLVFGLGGDDTLSGLAGEDTVLGGPGDDSLSGGNGNDDLIGGSGADVLIGGRGDDELYGGEGGDTLDGGEGFDNLFGDTGDDSLYGGDGDNALSGGAGNDSLYDGPGFGSLRGGPGADVLSGGGGADWLYGGPDADTLTGGTGNDAFLLSPGSPDTADTITDFTFGDRINFTDLGDGALPLVVPRQLDFNPTNSRNIGAGNPGSQPDYSRNDGLADVFWRHNPVESRLELWVDADDDGLLGNADIFAFLGSSRTVLGLDDFSDFLWVWRGSSTDDVLPPAYSLDKSYIGAYGLGGNDTLSGSYSGESLIGGSGNDSIDGQGGTDTLMGGPGNDLLDGGSDTDTAVFTGARAQYLISWSSATSSFTVSSFTEGTDTLTNVETLRFADGDYAATAFQVNTAPSLSTIDPLAGASEDTAFTVTYAMLASAADETDAQEDAISFRVELVTSGTLLLGGTAVIPGITTISSGQSLSWTPAANANGLLDAFTVRATDAAGASDLPAQVRVQTAPVNDAPVATSSYLNATEDTVATGTLQASDPDSASLSFRVVNPPSRGTVTIGTNGNYTYTPSPNQSGPDGFAFRVNDGSADSGTVYVYIFLAPVNDAPVLASPLPDRSVLTGSTVSFSLSAGTFTDVDNNTLIYSATRADGSPLPAWLSFNPTARTFSGTPESTHLGTVSIKVTANDGNLAASDTFDLAVSVRPNTAPIAGNALAQTGEDTALTTALPRATDADGDAVTYVRTTNPANGTVTVTSDGNFTYTPAANYTGPDSFTYTVRDGQGGSGTYTVSLTVTSVNDAPVVTPSSLGAIEDSSATGLLLAADIDSSSLSYIIVTSPSHGSVVLDSNGAYTYTPDLDFNGPDSFTFKASDGTVDSNTTVVSIVVTAVNDAPFAASADYSASEDVPLAAALPEATDVDNDTVSYSKTTSPANGTITVTANGTFTYTPAPNYAGPDSFGYAVSDGRGGSSTYTVSLTVNPVNDAPVPLPSSLTTTEDTIALGTLFASDIDNHARTYAIVSAPARGTVTLGANGGYVYAPSPNLNGPDGFTFRASDGLANSGTATVSIMVTAVNDAPVVASPLPDQVILLGASLGYTVAADAFVDVDNSSLTYSVNRSDGSPLPAWLSFDALSRTFGGTPEMSDLGTLSVRLTASDGSLTASDTFLVTVAETPSQSPGVEATVPAGGGGVELAGTAGNDSLTGTAGNDLFQAGPGNDTVLGGAGNDQIAGDAGLDVARFAYTRVNAQITVTAASMQVQAPDGRDTLTGVERLWFADRKLAFDLGAQQNAGQAALALGVLLPSGLTSPAITGFVLGVIDGGLDITGLCQLLDGQGILGALAGSTAPVDVARMAASNVLRTEAAAPLVDLLASFMDGRSAAYTPAQFLGVLASLEINQMAVDLVGLQQTGLSFA